MNILGISSDFHDSSAAIVRDGILVATAAEERFSYQKHDPTFPGLAIQACLKQAGLQAGEIDFVAYHESPAEKLSRVMASRLRDFPRGFLPFARSMRELAMGQLWIKFDIFQSTGIEPRKIHYVPHHLGHASYAFAASGFEDAAVLVIDAVGEWASTSWFKASRAGGRLEVDPAGLVPYPHSLGMLYSAFTGFLGFRINDSECSTMALASFGQPRYADRVRRILRGQGDGTYEIDLSFFDFSDSERLPVSRKFLELFGEPRSFRNKLPFAIFDDGKNAAVSEKDQYYADVAASIQAVLEDAVLALCAKLRRETGAANLCLAGGVALNATMNGRVIRESGFENVFVPPDPGDGGGAAGAALALFGNLPEARMPANPAFHPYLGADFSGLRVDDLASRLEFRDWSRHRVIPSVLGNLKGISMRRFEPTAFESLAGEVAEDLKKGKIVGWLQGRFENGPRALGNRSLLIDPANRDAARRLSRNVKLRAPYRPYACSVSRERSGDFFDQARDRIPPAMRWMASTHSVREEARAKVAQALHVDGTTRPQIVERSENPRFHRLLEAWESASGNPAILNTSFNESGYPMVSSPLDALLMFARTDIETLVLDDLVLRKEV